MSTGSPASHSLRSRSHDALTPTRSLAEFFSDLAGSLLAGYFIAQLVEHRTGIAEVTGSNPVEALIFSGFFFPIA